MDTFTLWTLSPFSLLFLLQAAHDVNVDTAQWLDETLVSKMDATHERRRRVEAMKRIMGQLRDGTEVRMTPSSPYP